MLNWLDELDAWLGEVERRMPEYNTLLLHNRVFQERTFHVGLLPREMAVRWGVTGPALVLRQAQHEGLLGRLSGLVRGQWPR